MEREELAGRTTRHSTSVAAILVLFIIIVLLGVVVYLVDSGRKYQAGNMKLGYEQKVVHVDGFQLQTIWVKVRENEKPIEVEEKK
jgi:uncharacterized ion transporter superfamily protein YfcC